MANISANLVYETSATTSSGTYTLSGAKSASHVSFGSVCANGDTVKYVARDLVNGGMEIGKGTWSTGGLLARTTILQSTNAGAPVVWGAGTREIYLTEPALSSKAIVIPIGINEVALTISQNDTTNNPRGISVTNEGTGAALFVDANGQASSSTSVGGAILLENTGNLGAGMIIYSNAGSAATGRLLNIRVGNVLFPQAAVHIDNDGTGNAFEILQNSTGTSSNGISLVSINPNDSSMGITGRETGKGTLKITHQYQSGVADVNASCLSLLLGGTAAGTAAQGIFIDSTAAQPTTGKLINARNDGIERFTVSASGAVASAGVQATTLPAPTIASAATIAPTKAITIISGTTAIVTITAPSPISVGGGVITLIPTGAWTTTTAGNIALASTAVVGKAMLMIFDTTTAQWYPSY